MIPNPDRAQDSPAPDQPYSREEAMGSVVKEEESQNQEPLFTQNIRQVLKAPELNEHGSEEKGLLPSELQESSSQGTKQKDHPEMAKEAVPKSDYS